ncbi:hypothetical protein IQ255_09945 [Pleurocapsales cyanobacterium LEGE 10410]|nr:hypothetical protein [Pleurocapsales cyanobacterium LEGE 10410]
MLKITKIIENIAVPQPISMVYKVQIVKGLKMFTAIAFNNSHNKDK